MYTLINNTFGRVIRFIERVKYFPISYNFIDEMRKKAILDSVDYAYEFLGQAVYRNTRESLWDYCLDISKITNDKITNKSKTIILEFGVWKGESINYFGKKCPQAEIYGFDSFTGLAEEWRGVVIKKGDGAAKDGIYKIGAFDNNGYMPKVPANVKLIKGYFQETLPKFSLKSKVSIIHIDCDTYESTIYILNKLAKNISKGSIIIFDEYFGFSNWRSHEHKALMDFSRINKKNFKYVAYTSVHVAVQIN
jgi:predicted O-methyltransferase YrrM